tara:strand:+ start:5621 stop:6352 length:732 start_codon:yes stop_codon:yes gene_type:complete
MKRKKNGLGIWQIINSNIITDIIAKSGFDITLLDLEHGLHTPQSIQDCVFAAKANFLFTIARIPCDSYQEIVKIIDTGIDGLLFPHIENNEQLNKILEQTLLPPLGSKSFSPFVTKYNYGKSAKDKKDNPYIGILIESVIGIKNSDKLLSNSNIDFVYFGAYDLSLEINKPGDIFNDEILKHLTTLIKYAKTNQKKILSIYRDKKELDLLNKLGVDFPIASVDTSHLMQKLKIESEHYLQIKN